MSRYYRVKTLMLKGEKGDTGYSITDIQMNDDYTLTITLENGMHFNTPPIRGEKGERGTGIRSVELRDDYSLLITLEDGKTLETTAILGKEFENIRTLEASASSASKIATNASTSASASAQSASQASISASESASNASTSASASAQSATNASQSAANAQESASSASTSADIATSKATEASASATKAKECEMNAKSSETNASNSAKEANTSEVNAKASEDKAKEYADNLQDSTETISKLNDALVNQKKAISELSDKKITKFYAGNLGETHIADSDNGLIQDMMIYGKSSQDGTPSPENPIEIKSVVNPTIKVCGKNLFNKNNFVKLDDVYIDKNNIMNKGSDNKGFVIKLSKGTYHYIQSAVNTDVQCAVFKESPKIGDIAEWGSHRAINVPVNCEIVLSNDSYVFIKYIYIYTNQDIQPQTILDSILLMRKGDDTSYEPYKEEQTITLPYTLNAVPVSTGGNVTIDGKQYIADYIDAERGKLVRTVKRIDLKNVSGLTNLSYGTHANGVGYLAYSISDSSNDIAVKDIAPLSNSYIGSQWINKSGYIYVPSTRSVIIVDSRFTDKTTAMSLIQDVYVIYALVTPIEEELTSEQVQALKELVTYYPTTNISTDSEQIEGYTVFNYPISLANGWNYVKKQLNDNRDYIYDMDLQSAEAYVNSEYAVTLTELEV